MIEIKEEFKKLIPALTAEEFKQLEENILKDGIRDSIVLWNNFIIDGHNRYQIAMKHELQFNCIDMEFEEEHQVIDWMILNQLGKRNITNEQNSYLIGKRYESEKQKHRVFNREYKTIMNQIFPSSCLNSFCTLYILASTLLTNK